MKSPYDIILRPVLTEKSYDAMAEKKYTFEVAVDAGKETVSRMTAAAAARELGVTPGRVSQMVKAGLLESFEMDGRTWLSRGSVEARKEEAPKAGRPRKAAVA